MDSEVMLNAGYIVLGGGLAAILGFVSQWVYARKQRKDDIKKIQTLLKDEFTDLYTVLMHEREANIRVKKTLKKHTSTIEEKDMAVGESLSNIIRFKLTIRVWDTIISSGNLIKLEHSQIKKIHNIRQKIKQHVKYMTQLETDLMETINTNINDNGKTPFIFQNTHNVHAVESYLKKCGKDIEESLDMLKDLDKELFDYDKIKNID